MGIVYPGIPKELASLLQQRFGIKFFVETGTYHGKTAYWASQQFSKVWTIEASESLYQEAVHRYENQSNITFILGNSKEKLTEILSDLDHPALFWFDAHWSGGVTFGEGEECPLLDELGIVNQSDVDHFLIIDDVRYFLAPPPPPHSPDQWPDIVRVLNELTKKERYITVIDDMIVAVPVFARATMIEYCRARYIAQQKEKEQEKRDAKIAVFQKARDLLNRFLSRF